MWRDIVDLRPAAAGSRAWIQDQLPQELTIGVDDAHLAVGDEQHDGLAAVPHAQADVGRLIPTLKNCGPEEH